MFSHIHRNVNLDDEYTTTVSCRFAEFEKLLEQSCKEYDEAKNILEETNKEITQNEEHLSIIEKERVKLMSELALQMQTLHELKTKVKGLKTTLQSTEFDLKKYQTMKLSTVDLETFARVKKTFVTYKNMLKIYFDYSNGANATVQKGYMFNRITKKLAYFEFNTEEKTVDDISRCLWNKMKLVSDKNWEML